MSTPQYELRQVEVSYEGRRILEVDQLEVQQGETLVVVGPNGAGKSTLLRLLNFLEAPSGGRLLFRGEPVPHPAPLELRRRVTTVFQRPALLNRTVWDNVAYGLRVRGGAPGEPLRELLRRLDLEDLAQARAGSLSGGEAQRVALARALAVRPQVLLLDEPTANLDPYNLSVVEGMIQQLRAEGASTLVIVTHNVFQARRLADRVAMLHGGRLIEVAAAAEFFDHPRDPRAAAFVRGELVA
ncbi:MAG TPA: phosphate ABC transporter ATP-binding protein [Anaerolineales bacterium]|nr:phosphate ABC transporter ATP-binding protein [Anaerolineales bacterium]